MSNQENVKVSKRNRSFRLSNDLVDKLKDRANKEHRSLNNLVEMILDQSIGSEPTQAK